MRLPKNFIQQNFYIVPNVPIQMNINGCRLTHHTLDGYKVLIHPVEILFLIPHIAIHFFLKGFQFLDVQFLFRLGNGLSHLGVAAEIHLLGIVRAAGKGWVDVHKVHLDTLLLQIGAGGDTLSTDIWITLRTMY